MSYVSHLVCTNCGKTYPAAPEALTCPVCGPEAGILDVVYDYEGIAKLDLRSRLARDKDPSIWRYSPLLPVTEGLPRPPLRVGGTPLYAAERLGAQLGGPTGSRLGLRRLQIKDDGLNPTGSLKDRASIIAVAKAGEAGAGVVACASTGNAASSLAGNAAAVGLRSCIFVPGRAPQGKVAQLRIYGATVISVQGSYRDAFELSQQAINRWGWYNRNAALNPYLVEGKKTVSLEIAEQSRWEVPDWVVFSVGDGCTIAGGWKGFFDLYRAGVTDRMPRLLGVQAEGANPISRAFHGGGPVQPTGEDTIADSIAVGVPRNPQKALRAVRESGGEMVDVSDEDIREAMRLLGSTTGVFGEPAGAAGLAGLKKLVGSGGIGPDERVVLVVTGNGLKDAANAIAAAGEPIRIGADLGRLEQALGGSGLV